MTPLPRTFIIKSNANNGTSPTSCLFPALLTLFPVIAFINEETTSYINEKTLGTINEAAIGAMITPRNQPFCFFI